MTRSRDVYGLRADVQLHDLQLRNGLPTLVRISAGEQVESICVRCPDTPCMSLQPAEIVAANPADFPADQTVDVCPSRALELGPLGAPAVRAEDCVSCGACVARCPVGAISLDPERGAVVHLDSSNADKWLEWQPAETLPATLQRFRNAPTAGRHLLESDARLDFIYQKIDQVRPRIGDRFDGLLVRGLFSAVGVRASLSRKGVTHMRAEMVLSPPAVKRGVVEVEFGQNAVLDAPRELLDDLAVLVSRYGWKLEETSSAVVTDLLPSRRSEYWHIIEDISATLSVRIGTISLAALMLSAWNRKNLNPLRMQRFYVDHQSGSYRSTILESLLGRVLELSSEARAEIEIAK